MSPRYSALLPVTICAMTLSCAAYAQSPEVKENPLKDAYFGETHVHTGVSMDAFIAGNRLTPDDAYRFAKGEQIMVNGSMHKIKRPLDFVAEKPIKIQVGTFTLKTRT